MRRERVPLRITIARVLIFVGVVCVLIAIVYEAVGYPWRILFTDARDLNVDRLPDPAPPDIRYVYFDPEDQGGPYGADHQGAPNNSGTDAWKPGAVAPTSELPGGGDGFFNAGGADNAPEPSYPPVVLLGAVKIPKLDVSVNLIEGISAWELLAGAGHVPGTAALGREGNAVIAGHRVTRSMHPFRHLDKMQAGDLVIVKYGQHTYTYSTISWFIVKNDENWVMNRVGDIPYCLTLVTCHPVGSARERLILRAELVDADGLAHEDLPS